MKVLVTSCTRNSGLSVVRALASAGFEVLGADDRPTLLGLRSRYAAAPYWQLPPRSSANFQASLLDAIERLEPDVFVPTHGTDVAVPLLAALQERTHVLLPGRDSLDVISDKARLLERCESLGIPTPRRFDADEACTWLRGNQGARLVVKPRADMGGGIGLRFIDDPGAVAAEHSRVCTQFGGAVVTEYIPGPVTNLLALHLLFDDDSRLVASFVLRKLRIWPADVGVTVAAVSTHEMQFVEQVLPLFEAVRWRGPAEAELKIDERDGRAKMLEVNPRFSGAVHFPIACGVNFPAFLCRAALGERLPETRAPQYAAGIHYIDTMRWLGAVSAELRGGSASLERLKTLARTELRGPRVPSVHKLSDPAPLLAKLWPSAWLRGRPEAGAVIRSGRFSRENCEHA
jgi:biotin carboxylase